MNKLLLFTLYSLFSITCSFAQVVKQGDRFTEVFLVQGKVVFLKEIPSKPNHSIETNYNTLKNWAKDNYSRDPFISSIRYDPKNHEIIAKSKIELLLPANSKGVREKMIMRYRVNAFLFQDKCVLEIANISYLYENTKGGKTLPKVIRAEDFITDNAIITKDNLLEFKVNTRKSTLYFLNELAKDFEKRFGY